MTSFTYFLIESGIIFSLDLDNYVSTLYYYNLLQGKLGFVDEYVSIPEELGGGVTKYPLSGDPVTGQGYVDGILMAPRDRRFMMNCGPFEIDKGESKDIIIAQMAAGATNGVNHLGSVSLFKEYSELVKDFYDHRFLEPKAFPLNEVLFSSSDESILLRWGNDNEKFVIGSYDFQGYNIYQLPYPNATLEESLRIKTFDRIDGVKVITEDYFDGNNKVTSISQTGNDTGIENELRIDSDFLRGTDLHQGTEYYYAITNYNYSESPWAGQYSFECSYLHHRNDG